MVYFWQMYTWELYWCMGSYFSGGEGGGGGGEEIWSIAIVGLM